MKKKHVTILLPQTDPSSLASGQSRMVSQVRSRAMHGPVGHLNSSAVHSVHKSGEGFLKKVIHSCMKEVTKFESKIKPRNKTWQAVLVLQQSLNQRLNRGIKYGKLFWSYKHSCTRLQIKCKCCWQSHLTKMWFDCCVYDNNGIHKENEQVLKQ